MYLQIDGMVQSDLKKERRDSEKDYRIWNT